MAGGPSFRILLNLALDSLLAIIALPVAVWAAAPGAWPPARRGGRGRCQAPCWRWPPPGRGA